MCLLSSHKNNVPLWPVFMKCMKDNKSIVAHLSMFGACAGWGLMAPVGKEAMLHGEEAMLHGVSGLSMVTFRVVGACVLFLLASLFTPKEQVPVRDKFRFAGAALFGLLLNQCCYTMGLSFTSPINASIVTTSMPIFAMLLSAMILKEPITGKKAVGVLMGCSGALMLILTSAAHVSDKVGDIRGDLLCLFAQFSFALYLSLYNPLIRRYNVFTINKYMFSWATLMLLPFTLSEAYATVDAGLSVKTWLEVGYVVGVGTFLCYILSMIGQRTLRPTVVSASLVIGVGVLKFTHAIAVMLVFSGVWLVTKSRAKNSTPT